MIGALAVVGVLLVGGLLGALTTPHCYLNGERVWKA